MDYLCLSHTCFGRLTDGKRYANNSALFYCMDGHNIHIGNLIKTELLRQDLSVSWLARRVCCDPNNLNKLLKKPSLHTDLLIRISVALQHDFFAEISSMVNQLS